MRVSVVNFCSTRVDMLRFSTEMLLRNAGTDDFDYVVTLWNPSEGVLNYVKELLIHVPDQKLSSSFRDRTRIRVVFYQTNEELEYVPNLRAMMNAGWDEGYRWNDDVVIVNADMAFGRDWLKNLVRRAAPDLIPNSIHVTPVKSQNRGVHTADFGVPTAETFQEAEFWKLHDEIVSDSVISEDDLPRGWIECATMPYVVNRRWWKSFGPWSPRHDTQRGSEPPDRQFFRRCHEGGARFLLCLDSICYHHEAVERRGTRPPGLETMKEGL
jgi:hypothetical protein